MVEILVGVNVEDSEGYARYREQMTPLLAAHGGSFGVDVRVAEVLRSPGEEPFNRLFTICFPTAGHLESFFADPRYLAVREKYFVPSVSATTRLGKYQVLVDT